MSGFVLVPLIYKSSPILFYGQNVQTGWRAQVEHEVGNAREGDYLPVKLKIDQFVTTFSLTLDQPCHMVLYHLPVVDVSLSEEISF